MLVNETIMLYVNIENVSLVQNEAVIPIVFSMLFLFFVVVAFIVYKLESD